MEDVLHIEHALQKEEAAFTALQGRLSRDASMAAEAIIRLDSDAPISAEDACRYGQWLLNRQRHVPKCTTFTTVSSGCL